MRIAHIENIANVAGILAEAQRKLGHDAVVLAVNEPPFGFPYDRLLRGPANSSSWNLSMLRNARLLSGFDVLHIHGGVWRSQLFWPVFRRLFPKKTLAVHFHGWDVRTGGGLHYLRGMHPRFFSTVDLRERVPGGVWVPNPIALPMVPDEPENATPRFGQFPTDRREKGTDLILEIFRRAFGPLETRRTANLTTVRGSGAELLIVSGVRHEEAWRIMTGCDVVIDSISRDMGYGMVGVEGMALGKPVLCAYRPDWYPGCPAVQLGKDSSLEDLRRLASDPAFRRAKGREGRQYVARVHEAGTIARQVLVAYDENRSGTAARA